jgi:hypothetical protein
MVKEFVSIQGCPQRLGENTHIPGSCLERIISEYCDEGEDNCIGCHGDVK